MRGAEHVVCKIRGAEELFSIIERKVSHHLLLNNSYFKWNAFDIACENILQNDCPKNGSPRID